MSRKALLTFLVSLSSCASREVRPVSDVEVALPYGTQEIELRLEVRNSPEVLRPGGERVRGEIALCNDSHTSVGVALEGFSYQVDYQDGTSFGGARIRPCSNLRVIPTGECTSKRFTAAVGTIHDIGGKSFDDDLIILLPRIDEEIEVVLSFESQRVVDGECTDETISASPTSFISRVVLPSSATEALPSDDARGTEAPRL